MKIESAKNSGHYLNIIGCNKADSEAPAADSR
jgi:hypothetical protein